MANHYDDYLDPQPSAERLKSWPLSPFQMPLEDLNRSFNPLSSQTLLQQRTPRKHSIHHSNPPIDVNEKPNKRMGSSKGKAAEEEEDLEGRLH